MEYERFMSFLAANMLASKELNKYKFDVDEGNDAVFVTVVVALNESIKFVRELMYGKDELKESKSVSFEELMADLKKKP